MTLPFDDRRQAGRILADRLSTSIERGTDVVVLALPRGGVPVGYEVASRLRAPLDVIVVRKLGVPGHEELAMGALASGGTILLNQQLIRSLAIPESAVRVVADRERDELARRERAYRDGRAPIAVAGKTVLLVDDGLATGSTMRAAAIAIREPGPRRVVVAVPIGAPEACAALREVADDVVCVAAPEPFLAVGRWYRDFNQTSDAEVRDLLARASPESAGVIDAREVRMSAGEVALAGSLSVPPSAKGMVLFAHGSGSSRHSPRNRFVAERLQAAGLATFLVDLLTPGEDDLDRRTREHRFDIGLLAERLIALGDALRRHPATGDLRLGLFGASTGGGAALVAAARRPDLVRAVVSRGGRPDLAGSSLGDVRAATLLIVGGEDHTVLELNRQAFAAMHGDHRLAVVPGASHLFEETGTLAAAADLARDWFVARLPLPTSVAPRRHS